MCSCDLTRSTEMGLSLTKVIKILFRVVVPSSAAHFELACGPPAWKPRHTKRPCSRAAEGQILITFENELNSKVIYPMRMLLMPEVPAALSEQLATQLCCLANCALMYIRCTNVHQVFSQLRRQPFSAASGAASRAATQATSCATR